MRALVHTLNALLERADQLFDEGPLSKALQAYEELLSTAQEKMDRSTEVMARSRIAECCLIRQEEAEASEQLSRAAEVLDVQNRTAHGRYKWAQVRCIIATDNTGVIRETLEAYVQWAEEASHFECLIDGCCLLANQSEDESRIQWLERALQVGQETQTSDRLGRICNDLASALDVVGRRKEALEAYELALGWHRMTGSVRDQVGACWAIGTVALREEDLPLARERLEEAVQLAGDNPDHQDLAALSLADLARVHHESGDEIEARRLLIRGLILAKEVDLAAAWNQAWRAMLEFAKVLDIKP